MATALPNPSPGDPILASHIDNIVTFIDGIGENVVDHGALGDNSTNDAAAFQAAHDALPATGGTIIVPTPTTKYAIATTITITKPVRVVGRGWGSILRANGSITAIFTVNDGGEGSIFEKMRLEGNKTATGGTILRGIEINGATDCTVRDVLFSGPNATTGLNFGVDIVGATSNRTKVLNCRFERLASSSGNGSAVLVEGSSYNQIVGNDIDASEFNNFDSAPGAAIALTQLVSANAASDNFIAFNVIHGHPQAGISIGSTSYTQFANQLPAGSRNLIIGNDIYDCGAAGGGDAGSGIAMVGRQSGHLIARNKIHGCGGAAGGYGIALSGSQRDSSVVSVTDASNATPIVITAAGHGRSNGQTVGVQGVTGNTAANGSWTVANVSGDTFELQGSVGNGAYAGGGLVGLASTAAYDESPDKIEIIDNQIYENDDHGLRINGPTNCVVQGNVFTSNGQRTANTFANVHIARVGGSLATGNSNLLVGNAFFGTQTDYQIEIAAGPTATAFFGNVIPIAGTSTYSDGGTSTVIGTNLLNGSLSGGAYDATVPAAVGTAAAGTAGTQARRDHVHPTGAGTPSTQAFADAAAVGTGPAAAMTDHKHAMPEAYPPEMIGRWDYDWNGRLGGTATVTGTGTLSYPSLTSQAIYAFLGTGATTGGTASHRLELGHNAVTGGMNGVGKCRLLQFTVEWSQLDADMDGWVYLTDENATTQPSDTARHIGIRHDGTTVYFSTADGTTEQATDISSFVSATLTQYFFDVTFDGTTAKLYVNGTLRATHATNVPANAATTVPIMRGFVINSANAAKTLGLGKFHPVFVV